MIVDGIEFFNVASTERRADGGLSLYRFPESVLGALTDMGAEMARKASCAEIRFVTDATRIRITLGGHGDSFNVHVYCGDYKYKVIGVGDGVKRTITLSPIPGFNTYKDLLDTPACRHRYSHDVWRIIIPDGCAVFYSFEMLDGSYVRPPKADEVPKKMLVYGSSISHGCWADNPMMCYPMICAEMLGIDALNKGMSGSCRQEREMTDYLAAEDFDIAFLELTTNMTNPADFTFEEVMTRTEYLLSQMCEKHPDKPIIFCGCFSPAPRYPKEKVQRSIDITAEINKRYPNWSKKYPNLHYFDSNEVYDKKYYATFDFCHPGDFGQIHMALNLKDIITKYIG